MDLRVVVVYPFGGGNNKADLLVRVVRHRMEERSADHDKVRRECQQGKHEAQRAGRLYRLHVPECYPVPPPMSNAAAGAPLPSRSAAATLSPSFTSSTTIQIQCTRSHPAPPLSR